MLFSVQNLAGSAGNFSSRSGSTIFSKSDVTFNNYTGGTLWIQNLGNITSGDIKITAINPNIQSFPDPPKDPNNSAPIITKEPALVFKAGGDKASENSLANIRVGRIENATGKPIDIQGTGNIQINAIVSRGSTINICSNGCIPDRTTEEKGSITVLGNVDAGVGGSISLFAPDKITTQDLIAFLNPSVTQGNSGGFVTLRSSGNITTSSIQTGERGNINLTSTKGSIDTSQGQQISGGRIFLVALDQWFGQFLTRKLSIG